MHVGWSRVIWKRLGGRLRPGKVTGLPPFLRSHRNPTHVSPSTANETLIACLEPRLGIQLEVGQQLEVVIINHEASRHHCMVRWGGTLVEVTPRDERE